MIHSREYFTDEIQGVWRSHPLDAIRSADKAGLSKLDDDEPLRPGARRVVHYDDHDNNVHLRLVLRLVELPKALTDMDSSTLGATSGSPEGRVLDTTGEYAGTAKTAATGLLGFTFAEYYAIGGKNRFDTDPDALTDLSAGDWIWVITEGKHQVLCASSAAGAAGDVMFNDSTKAGSVNGVAAATAITSDLLKAVIGQFKDAPSNDAKVTAYVDLDTRGYHG